MMGDRKNEKYGNRWGEQEIEGTLREINEDTDRPSTTELESSVKNTKTNSGALTVTGQAPFVQVTVSTTSTPFGLPSLSNREPKV